MKNAMLALFALTVIACGSTAHQPADAASQGESCAGHTPNEACMNEDNFAACRAREAECPGQVLTLESCPLQFACP